RPALLRNEIRRRAGVERVEWRAELGLGGEHADDAVACAVDRRRLTDDRTVATELRLPRGVAEYDHTGRALGEVAGNKYSADRGAQPEHRGKLGAYGGPFEHERSRRDVNLALPELDRTDRVDRSRLPLPERDLGHCRLSGASSPAARIGKRGLRDRQPIGVGIGKWSKVDRVNDAEHRRRSTDAEGEERGRGDGEAGRAAERAKGDAQVAREIGGALVPPKGSQLGGVAVDAFGANGVDIAEPAARLGGGVVGGESAGTKPFFAHGEMEGELLVDFPSDIGGSLGGDACGASETRQAPHAFSGIGARSARVNAPTSSCQAGSCWVSRARPAAVRR